MGFLGLDPVKGAGGWEDIMTEQEIADMEKKGVDMSAVRKKENSVARRLKSSVKKLLLLLMLVNYPHIAIYQGM
ncbi:hypothetical protein [Anaerotignum sp.]|uniref:hypothetical protein n=1 Tax=Anaerotignum sp. TaxID=2039241 RepID=UPI0028AD1E81|nr:hypothetical protein [Anaerotignum sp.]